MTKAQEKIIERLAVVIEQVYFGKRRLFWTNLAAGVIRGIGATVGTAVVLGVTALILQWFGVWEDVQRWLNAARF